MPCFLNSSFLCVSFLQPQAQISLYEHFILRHLQGCLFGNFPCKLKTRLKIHQFEKITRFILPNQFVRNIIISKYIYVLYIHVIFTVELKNLIRKYFVLILQILKNNNDKVIFKVIRFMFLKSKLLIYVSIYCFLVKNEKQPRQNSWWNCTKKIS